MSSFNSINGINPKIKSKHRSISLNSKKSVNNSLNSIMSNFSPTNKTKRKSTNSKALSQKSTKSKPDCLISTLPKVSIDLNETPTLKLQEIINLRNKLKELTNDKIKFLNKNYIKELKTLKDTIDSSIVNGCVSNSNSASSNLSSTSTINNG